MEGSKSRKSGPGEGDVVYEHGFAFRVIRVEQGGDRVVVSQLVLDDNGDATDQLVNPDSETGYSRELFDLNFSSEKQ